MSFLFLYMDLIDHMLDNLGDVKFISSEICFFIYV